MKARGQKYSCVANWWKWALIPYFVVYDVLVKISHFPTSPIIWLIAITTDGIIIIIISRIALRIEKRVPVEHANSSTKLLICLSAIANFFIAAFIFLIGYKTPQVLSPEVRQLLNGYIQTGVAYLLTAGVSIVGLVSGIVTLYDFFIVRHGTHTPEQKLPHYTNLPPTTKLAQYINFKNALYPDFPTYTKLPPTTNFEDMLNVDIPMSEVTPLDNLSRSPTVPLIFISSPPEPVVSPLAAIPSDVPTQVIPPSSIPTSEAESLWPCGHERRAHANFCSICGARIQN